MGARYMSKYKKGDIVKLACNDIEEAIDSTVGFNDYMLSMLGSVRVIERIKYSDVHHAWIYYMKGSRWMWREDWLLPIEGRVDVY
jgi:hypothetical protein